MKVHAKHRQPSRESVTLPPTFLVDYAFVSGDIRSDCASLTIGGYANESQLNYLLKQALLVYLRTKYAPETFTTSDVVMF
jgi:hypothetical protein